MLCTALDRQWMQQVVCSDGLYMYNVSDVCTMSFVLVVIHVNRQRVCCQWHQQLPSTADKSSRYVHSSSLCASVFYVLYIILNWWLRTEQICCPKFHFLFMQNHQFRPKFRPNFEFSSKFSQAIERHRCLICKWTMYYFQVCITKCTISVYYYFS